MKVGNLKIFSKIACYTVAQLMYVCVGTAPSGPQAFAALRRPLRDFKGISFFALFDVKIR